MRIIFPDKNGILYTQEKSEIKKKNKKKATLLN